MPRALVALFTSRHRLPETAAQSAPACARPRVFPRLLALALLLGLFTPAPAAPDPPAAGEHRPLVLILHSYGPGVWVANLQQGLLAGLNEKPPYVDYYVDYMDARRIESPDYLEQLGRTYRLRYREIHFDLVVACDDAAYEFALAHREETWPRTPVVFCGLDELRPAELSGQPNITGLAENNDLGPLLSCLAQLQPQVRRLLVLGDDSAYSRRLTTALDHAIADRHLPFALEPLDHLTTEKIIARLEHAAPTEAVFYLSLWRESSGRIIPNSEAQRILQRSAVPVLTVRESFIGQGAFAGSYVDGAEHGLAAGRLAKQVLLGAPAAALAPRLGPPRRLAFDAPSLARLHLPRGALPPGSLIVNEPFSFYRTYRTGVWLTISAFALLCTLVLILVVNIAQRRRAVTRLRESEGKLHAIFDQTYQLAGLTDIDGRILAVNATALDFAGCTEAQVLGRLYWETPWWSHDPGEQRRAHDASRRAATGEIVRFETHHRNAAGELRRIDFSIKPIRAPDGRTLYLLPEGRDITDTRRTEEHLHAVLESAPLILWAIDLDGRFTLSIGSGLRALGLEPNQVVGQDAFAFYHNHPDICACLRRAQAGESVRALNTIGERTFEAHYAPQLGPTGAVIGTKGVAIDATERLAAQATRLQLAAVVEQAAEQIILTDAHGLIRYVNPAFEKVSGYTRQEVLGQPSRTLIVGEQDAAFVTDLRETLANGRVWSGRFHTRRKDGTILLEDATITPLLGDTGETQGYIGIKRDVTQQVQLEETLRQTQRTEAIGKLAGGVAHDFNNILQVIKANVSFSREFSAGQRELDEYLAQIDEAATRAADLTRQLLAFGRKQALQIRIIDPARVVADLLKLIRRLIGAHIQIDFQPPAAPLHVRADPGQLEQVVLNLCVNARDAMPDGGRLALALHRLPLTPAQLPPGCAPGDYVELTVSDTGVGMNSETSARIFEPFFTTKPVGQGTGLGLSVVQGIVQQHEGFIEVSSEPGLGTTFSIYLPAARPAAPAAPPPPAAPAPTTGTGETILLAEDDPGIRALATRILERRGYHVLAAADGEEACTLGRQHLDRIALAVLDVIMPKLNGIEAAKRLRELRPALPIVLCSGYASGLPSGGLPHSTLVPKPYAIEDLLAAIQKELKDHATPA